MPIFHNRRDLLDRFRKGDRLALEEVYRAYVATIHGIVRQGFHRSGAGEGAVEAADLVQDIFVKAFSPSARLAYDGVRPYGPYLYSIARYALVDWARRRGREIPTEGATLELALDQRVAEEPPYADPTTMAAVERFLREVPPELKAVHEKRYTLGLSQEEAAAALGISRQRLRTAEARLRSALARALSRSRQQLRPVA